MSWTGKILGGSIAVGLVVAIGYGFVPRAPLVDTAEVTRGPLQVTIREEGRTRVKDRYVISSPVPGFAHRVTLRVGDEVAAQQTILRLEPLSSTLLDPRTRAEAKASVSVAQARLNVAEQTAEAAASDASLARTEFDRISELHSKGTSPKNDLDRAAAELRAKDAMKRSAEFTVEVARYELTAAKAAFEFSSNGDSATRGETLSVSAPLAGKVLRVLHESEGVVPAGGEIIELGDPGALEVEVEVLSADAVQIGPGMRVTLDHWGGKPLEGKVRVVEPIGFTKVSALGVEEQRVLVIVDLVSPQVEWRELGDGYRAEATFVLWEGEDVLTVPNSALFRGEGGWEVFLVRYGVAEAVPVVLGQRNGLQSEVREGLSAGDTVVTHPDDQISSGVAVRPRD